MRWFDAYKNESSEIDAWKLSWVEEHFKHHPEGITGWVEKGELTSLILFQKVDDLIDIHFLWTPQKSRRQGCMRKLLLAFVDYFEGHKIWLEVREKNTPAVSLYKSLGFALVGTRVSYYSSKESACLFSL